MNENITNITKVIWLEHHANSPATHIFVQIYATNFQFHNLSTPHSAGEAYKKNRVEPSESKTMPDIDKVAEGDRIASSVMARSREVTRRFFKMYYLHMQVAPGSQ